MSLPKAAKVWADGGHVRDGVEIASIKKDDGSGDPIYVAFNPESLQYDFANQLKTEGNEAVQYVSQSSAKLSMELLWDTTDSGEDVRKLTSQVLGLMKPPEKSSAVTRPMPPTVLFEWGTISFRGYIESFKEVIDFFASNGVPLRSRVNIVLTSQASVFDADAAMDKASADVDDAIEFKSTESGREFKSGHELQRKLDKNGKTDNSHDAGAKNGLADIRKSPPGSVVIAAGAAFKAGASMGVGLSAGAGASASLSMGASFGAGASLSAGGGLSAGGSRFGGLRIDAKTSPTPIDGQALLRALQPPTLSVSSSAGFLPGGRVVASGGIKADVGQTFDLRAKLTFEGG